MRLYTIQYAQGIANLTNGAAVDVCEVQAPTTGAVRIVSWSLTSQNTEGGAREYLLPVTMQRGVGSTGGDGTVLTPQPLADGDSAAAGTYRKNATTNMTGGTIEQLEAMVWPVRFPLGRIYMPPFQPVVSPSNRLVLRFEPPSNFAYYQVNLRLSMTFQEL